MDRNRVMPEPSFRGNTDAECTTGERIAFALAGQARTLVLPAAHESLRGAIRSFSSGDDSDVFVYITNDDAGATNGNAGVRDDKVLVDAALAVLRPQQSYYGPFGVQLPKPGRGCVLSKTMLSSQCGGTRCARDYSKTWHRWWATWEKVRRAFQQVVEFELQHGFRYGWVCRLRLDLWVFGAVPTHCSMSSAGAGVAIPAGVVGCFCGQACETWNLRLARSLANRSLAISRDPELLSAARRDSLPHCANDHMAFVPRALASAYFETALDVERCTDAAQFANFTDLGGRHLWSRLLRAGVPLAPAPVVPYSLLRSTNCTTNDEGAATTMRLQASPDCFRWRWRYASSTGWPPVSTASMRVSYERCLEEWSAVRRGANASSTCPAATTGGFEKRHLLW